MGGRLGMDALWGGRDEGVRNSYPALLLMVPLLLIIGGGVSLSRCCISDAALSTMGDTDSGGRDSLLPNCSRSLASMVASSATGGIHTEDGAATS